MKTNLIISHKHSGTRPVMDPAHFGLMMAMLYSILAYIATAFESENDDKHVIQAIVTEGEDGVRLHLAFHLCQVAKTIAIDRSGFGFEEVLTQIDFVDAIVMEMVSGKAIISGYSLDVPSIASDIALNLGLTRKV